MSVTRALAELKVLEKRIAKVCAEGVFITTSLTARNTTDQDMRSTFSSAQDLIKRYEQLKFAIVRSNAETKVKIGGKTYTVAEAIAMKDWCLKHSDSLCDTLRRQRKEVLDSVDLHNRQLQTKIDNLLQVNFKERATSADDMKTIKDAYLKNNEIKVNDPLNIDLRILQLNDEIENFRRDVDFSLSESNAVTMIRV